MKMLVGSLAKTGFWRVRHGVNSQMVSPAAMPVAVAAFSLVDVPMRRWNLCDDSV
jgi:hypothetical protein